MKTNGVLSNVNQFSNSKLLPQFSNSKLLPQNSNYQIYDLTEKKFKTPRVLPVLNLWKFLDNAFDLVHFTNHSLAIFCDS